MTDAKRRMLAGEWFHPGHPALRAERERARRLCRELAAAEPADRPALIEALTGRATGVITPPFVCDYGYHVELGPGAYLNAGCTLLDIAPIRIGADTLIGPGVHIYTVTHPMDADERRSGVERGRPVVIGRDVWIGGAAVILPGVEIGDRSVIGAGSVVTRSVPADVFAAGNPCRVIRRLTGEGDTGEGDTLEEDTDVTR